MIHVNRGATTLGAFPEKEVREGLRTGRFQGSDLGWKEGMSSWKQLSQFAEFSTGVPAVVAAPAPADSGNIPPMADAPAERSGLPWEHRQGRSFFGSLIETLSMVLIQTRSGFSGDENGRRHG